MALINHSAGYITKALLLDRTGGAAGMAQCLFAHLEPGAVLYYVVVNTNEVTSAQLTVYGQSGNRLFTKDMAGQEWDMAHTKKIDSLSGTDDVSIFTNATGHVTVLCKGTFKSVLHWVAGMAMPEASNTMLDFYLENGDVIASKDFVLIGREASNHYYHDTQEPIAPYIARQYYGGEQCPPITIIGDAEPKDIGFFHLDMYVTYGGVHRGGHLFFVGELREQDILMFGDSSTRLKKLRSQQAFLNNAAAHILTHIPHAAVARLPLMSRGNERIFTYNNVLIEHRAGHRPKCIIPHYTHTISVYTTDSVRQQTAAEECYREAWAVYDSYGFDVRPVDVSVAEVGQAGVGLHCLVVVLARSQA